VGEGIKAVDPGAKVVTAGLNESELGIKLVPFLDGMYRAGAKGTFDVLALHPYAPGSDLVRAQIGRAVRELRRNGDPARTLVTELGWATGGPPRRALVVSEAGQSSLIRRTVTELARYRGRLRLDGVFYFNWRDVSAAPGTRDHWGLHTGLMREDGSPKPALQALTDVTWAIPSG
jgi:polysaccharide biosynthesis protein PslG